MNPKAGDMVFDNSSQKQEAVMFDGTSWRELW
jgi:hypothetical protein